MTESLPLDLMQALELFALERTDAYAFVPVTPPPAWVTQILSGATRGQPLTLAAALPFLDRFLSEAEAFWRDGTRRSILSGPFVAVAGGEELLLRACALNLGPRSVLVLERLRGDADIRPLLQKARENKLVQEQLQRQVDGVRAPVAAIAKAVADLLETSLTPTQRSITDRIAKALARLEGPVAG